MLLVFLRILWGCFKSVLCFPARCWFLTPCIISGLLSCPENWVLRTQQYPYVKGGKPSIGVPVNTFGQRILDLRGSETWLSVSNFLINPRPVENVGVVSVVPWEVKGRRVYEIGLGISGRGWQSNLKLCEDDTVMGWWRGVVIRIHIIWRKPKEGPGFKRKGELGSWKIAVKITTIIMPIGNTELKTLGRGNSCPYSLTYCQAALSSESWKLLFFFFFLWVPTVSHQTWVKISSTEWDPRCTSGPQHHLTWGPIVRCVPHVWGQRDTRLWVFTAPEAWTLSHIAPNNTCLVF